MSSAPPGGTDPFDSDRLLELVDGDLILLAEMNTLLWEDVPRWLESIEHAGAHRDGRALASSCHALRGALANFFAPRATHHVEHLEESGKQERFDQFDTQHQRLREELASLEAALAAFLGSP